MLVNIRVANPHQYASSSSIVVCYCGSTVVVGNLLKPQLARGELRCIGATTLDEYRKYIEKDPALERRFQQVGVGVGGGMLSHACQQLSCMHMPNKAIHALHCDMMSPELQQHW